MRTTLKDKIVKHLTDGKALSSQYVVKIWNGQPDALTKVVYKLRKSGMPIELSKGKPSRYRLLDSYFEKLARKKHEEKI